MTNRPLNVLFICSQNTARSIFAEALLRQIGGEQFVSHSAGVNADSELNPFALEVLRQLGHDTSVLRAKNTDEFRGPDAPKMDFVITVCDIAANEECAPWPGQPLSAHWGVEDPAKVEGTDAEKALAFKEVYRQLRQRILSFTSIPFEDLSRMSLQQKLDDIASQDDADAPSGSGAQ